ncbi:NAD-dependent malic enzyme, partial [Singulisphaera rosea]
RDRYASLFPPLEDITEVSKRIALAVGIQAQAQGLASPTAPEVLERTIEERWWEPSYPKLKRRV